MLVFITISVISASLVIADFCPDGSTCPGSQSCCPALFGGYSCCAYAEGVCCWDKLECCPSGTTCVAPFGCFGAEMASNGTYRTTVSEPVVIESNIASESTGLCPTNDTECDGDCCPLPNAVCCADKLHCCPEDTVCDQERGQCRGRNRSFRMTPTSNAPISSENDIKYRVDESCSPSETECTSGSCCPLPNAVCCEDERFCCPKNYQCFPFGLCVGAKDGRTPGNYTLYTKKAAKLREVPIRIQDCPSGTTECGTGCCPLPNAVCCPDREHCCPQGYHCDLEGERCLQNGLKLSGKERKQQSFWLFLRAILRLPMSLERDMVAVNPRG